MRELAEVFKACKFCTFYANLCVNSNYGFIYILDRFDDKFRLEYGIFGIILISL